MPLEIQVHAGAEARSSEQGVNHADHFRALVIDGRGIEIADLDIGLRADRMGHRSSVFGELRGAQQAHFLDALHGVRVAVAAILLIAEDRQAFLQT